MTTSEQNSVEKSELIEYQIASPENLKALSASKTKEQLAEMAILQAVDFRRLLGTLDCIEMYMASGEIQQARKIVDDGLDFYQAIARIRAKEILV